MLLALSRLFRALPLPWALRVARGVAWVWYYLVPVRRRVAWRNVERVYGAALSTAQKRAIVRGSFASLCMYVVEGLRLPSMTAAVSAALVDGSALTEAARPLFARGKGIIGVTAHIGNLDLLGCSQAARGLPVHALLKDISWDGAQRFWQQIRAATGMGRIAPRRSGLTIRNLLASNQLVAFAIDQHVAKKRAIVCDLFGQLAATTPAPVRFALATGAAILPVVMQRTDAVGHHVVHAGPEFVLETPYADFDANVRHNTERLNRILEGWVRAWPEQWFWVHKRWKVQDDPAGWDVPVGLRDLAGL